MAQRVHHLSGMTAEYNILMKSINFEFLRDGWPELAALGGFAEAYAHSDAVGAIAKLRMFGEQVVEWIHHHQKLPRPYQANFLDLLNNPPFRETVPEVVVSKLHALRMEGNKAVHGNQGDTTSALRLTHEAFDIGRWAFVNYAGGRAQDCPAFQEPPQGGAEGVAQRKEKRATLERLAAQEAQLQKLLQELEEQRAKAQEAVATAEERQAALEAALKARDELKAVDPLAFDEAETRRYLIDQMLADEGWDVAADNDNTEEVRKEYSVPHQSTPSGDGLADYVLFDDNGKPLAVIEAKKTSADPQIGRTQAREYADGLEKLHGQRPVIFFTNGYDLWIWNDAAGEPWRKLYGFYSKDSLQHLIFQRTEKKPVSEVAPNPAIAGRMYQIEAVRRIVEKFAEKKRKALIVQATGTGKTRVAISLSDAMIRAGWAKRILFLCDRRELRKQAANTYKEFLPSEPRTFVTGASAGETQHRIYLATYPAMMKVYESFDVGFFDLIIADESHRSLYNRYRQLFDYFDCYQVGLTATPVDFVARNTYRMFECEEEDPTSHYSYEEAITNNPPYLVPFRVDTHTTQFLRDGIKYKEMTEEQKKQLEEDEEVPEAIDYEQPQVDKIVYNKDTNRHILRNLMDNGIRVADGTRLGKTIIFARSKRHARLLEQLFNEMYPQYGGNFCQTIVSDDPRAETLIDDFKGQGNNPDLTIAISVDMLDTGVDVPEVVNLVFAKPVYSYVKFWQMIGRGTRLCPNLFGPGDDKTHFQIFDHWGNFKYFEQDYKRAEPTRSRSLVETVFESRLDLAEAALEQQNSDAFELATDLIRKDIAALPEKSIPVRDNWKTILSVRDPETLREFSAATSATLRNDIAPLMQWVDIKRQQEAWKFDRLIARAQVELIRGSSTFDDKRDDIVTLVSSLRINLSQVKVKLPLIEKVKSAEFWDHITVQDLEQIRRELRGIVQFRIPEDHPQIEPKIIDVTEDVSQIERKEHKVKFDRLTSLDMVAYRNRVTSVLQAIIDQSETLQKIRQGEEVTQQELEELCSLVLTQEPDLDLHDLAEYFPQAGSLDRAIRGIIGLDAQAVHERFTAFVQAHPNLASHQIKFLDLLQNHIARYGSIRIEQLYESPFTTLHSDGPDGLFDEPLVDELLEIIESFESSETGQ
ncbi:DEAD/DEAH box helicase family protein [Maioricimonas sp. JC845]|uniref:DEAD/DEAH box helicase family protein n=1 Tax=Maioricimonas sp. JC845 TaxID=3232138 RepID=UPI00345B1885